MSEFDRGQEPFQGIAAVEDSAKLRMGVEDRILHDGAPLYAWKDEYNGMLAAYPRLGQYRPILDPFIDRVVRVGENLHGFWFAKKHFVSQAGAQEIHPGLEKGNKALSTDAFRTVFEQDPLGEVAAFRGAVTLRFVTGQGDFDAIYSKFSDLPSERHTAGAYTVHPEGYSFGVLMLQDNSESESLDTMHELEHGKNQLLYDARGGIYRNYSGFEDRLKLSVDKLWYREDISKNWMRRAKDEILALFTVCELAEPEDQDVKNFFFTVVRGAMLKEETPDELKEGSTDEPTGEYREKYLYEGLLSEEDLPEYDKVILRSLMALEHMYIHYLDRGERATRMTTHVLEQFPITQWPAVVRLIERYHAKESKQ